MDDSENSNQTNKNGNANDTNNENIANNKTESTEESIDEKTNTNVQIKSEFNDNINNNPETKKVNNKDEEQNKSEESTSVDNKETDKCKNSRKRKLKTEENLDDNKNKKRKICNNVKKKRQAKLTCSPKTAEEYNFSTFPRYQKIQRYLRYLESTYPKKVQVVSIGKTVQNRDINMIIIKSNLKKVKHGALIDAGIHAREWLTNTTVLYFINHLLKDNSLLEKMDFYIIPCLNPDGYEYTHTCKRLWRKNMNTNGFKKDIKWGVDLNRNFPINFGKKGSSKNPTKNTYRGKEALSEPETRALSAVMKQYEGVLKLYISVHSYGNYILYPWGFTKRSVKDRDVIDSCANAAKIAMYKSNKRWFHVGTAASQMYLVSGSSTDYAMDQHKIKFSYCIELQKYGESGFQPKPRHIKPIGKETLEGFKSMVTFVYDYYEKKRKNLKLCVCEG